MKEVYRFRGKFGDRTFHLPTFTLHIWADGATIKKGSSVLWIDGEFRTNNRNWVADFLSELKEY